MAGRILEQEDFMDFLELAKLRQSCRAYDETREVEPEKLHAILEAGRLAPQCH